MNIGSIEENELIAKYDGGAFYAINYSHHNALRTAVIAADVTNYRLMGYNVELRYNQDWNNLLPVVKKILNDLQETKDKNQGDSPVYGECIETEGWIIGSLLDIEMEEVYKGVLQGIRIINSNK